MAQNRRALRPDAHEERGEENASQLRDDIDAGRTRDKIDHPDPATAPLGTDAEAGGAPWSAQRAEADEPRRDPKRRWYGTRPPDAARPALVGVVTAVVVIIGLVWFFLV